MNFFVNVCVNNVCVNNVRELKDCSNIINMFTNVSQPCLHIFHKLFPNGLQTVHKWFTNGSKIEIIQRIDC